MVKKTFLTKTFLIFLGLAVMLTAAFFLQRIKKFVLFPAKQPSSSSLPKETAKPLPPPQKTIMVKSSSGDQESELDAEGVNGVVESIGSNILRVNGRDLSVNPLVKVIIDIWPTEKNKSDQSKYPKEAKFEEIKVGDIVNTYFLKDRKSQGIYFIRIYKS